MKALRTLADGIGGLMFAAVFLLFCMKIVMRYVWHDEFAWTDEVCTILFIWIIFWANSFMLTEKNHIRFDLLVRWLPPRVSAFLASASALLVCGIFIYSLPGTIDYVMFLRREKTPVLQLPLSYVYFCFAMYAVMVSLRYAHAMTSVLGKGLRRRRSHGAAHE